MLGVLLAMVGIIQRATFNGKIYGFWELVQGGNPFGPFVNRNHFAGWMLMAVPTSLGLLAATMGCAPKLESGGSQAFAIACSGCRLRRNRAILIAFAVLVMALSLVLTMSRSGILGLLCACLWLG